MPKLQLWVTLNKSRNLMRTFAKGVLGCLITAAAVVAMGSFNGQVQIDTMVLEDTPPELGLTHQQLKLKFHSSLLKDSGEGSSPPLKPGVKALASIWERHITGLAGVYMVIVLITLYNMLLDLLALRCRSHK